MLVDTMYIYWRRVFNFL